MKWRSERAGSNGARRGLVGLVLGLLALGALLVPALLGAAASASPAIATATTNCGTGPGCTSSTTAGSTTTSGTHIVITLKASYSSGVLSWQSCGYPAGASGSNVNLYINGEQQTETGGSGAVQSNGCTTDPNIAVCLAPGTYTLASVDGQYTAATLLTVATSGCANPITIGSTRTGTGSGLAFTGANILLSIAAAALLIVLGYALVRLNRQRRRAS